MTIENCSISASHYMRQLCSMFVADNWLWMVLPLALCAILAFFIDVRFVIVAMMVLFIVMPLVLAMLYFYYGLSPEARWSIMEKELTIDKEGITLTFTDERMKKHIIAWDNVLDIVEKDDVCLLMLRGKRYTCLMLPASAVDPDVAQVLGQLASQAH